MTRGGVIGASLPPDRIQRAIATHRCRSELWRQARGLAIRDKFPKYTATLTEVEDGSAASVVVKYVDGRVQRLPAAHLALLDIFDGMAEFTEALQVKEEMDELEKG